MTSEVLNALSRALAEDDAVALVTIVATHGSTPQRTGAKMVVYPDGRIVGTIGGGCYENDAATKAREILRVGERARLVHYELSDDFAEETGLICGGRMDVFIEPIEPTPHLYILGAGHVGWQLGSVAPTVGFRVHVIDDRQKFANAERFPDAEEIVVDSIPDWLERTPIPASAYVVVLTRGHRQDYDALRLLAGRPLRYVGLIGSRAKVARLTDRLVSEGVDVEWLRALRAPVGLDIGAVTPEEIAVSIVAELVAARRGKLGDETRTPSLQWTAPVLKA